MRKEIVYEGQEALDKWEYEGKVIFKEGEKSWDCKLQDKNIMKERSEYFIEKVFKDKIIPSFLGSHPFYAYNFALLAHQGQYRKYNLVPYIIHPQRVANSLDSFLDDENYKYHSELLSAAYLHDVVEDCGVELDLIKKYFGEKTASVVDDLTEKFKSAVDDKGKLLPRATRNEMECNHLKSIGKESKWIKMLDRLDNLSDMSFEKMGGFFLKYLNESKLLMEAVGDGDPILKERLSIRINDLLSK